MRLSPLLLALPLAFLGARCALLSGAAACANDRNCPFEQTCVAGTCVAGAGEGEGEGAAGEGEGEGAAGEGEGEGAAGEGEGEGAAGEGEGEGAAGEGEGEGAAGEGEGEGEGEGAPGCTVVNANLDIGNNGATNIFNGETCVDLVGNVTMHGSVNDIGGLVKLHTVSGSFNVNGSNLSGFDLASFDQLVSIDGNVTIDGTSVRTVSLGTLQHIGGSLNITNNDNADTLGFSQLTSVDGSITISNNLNLCDSRVDSFFNRVTTGGSTSASNNKNGC